MTHIEKYIEEFDKGMSREGFPELGLITEENIPECSFYRLYGDNLDSRPLTREWLRTTLKKHRKEVLDEIASEISKRVNGLSGYGKGDLVGKKQVIQSLSTLIQSLQTNQE